MLPVILAVALLLAAAPSGAEDKQPPEKLVFASKAGQVTFGHAAHLKRRNGHCTPCHQSLWPKSAKEPLKSSDGCKTCHQAGGTAFEMKGNCKKCHTGDGQGQK